MEHRIRRGGRPVFRSVLMIFLGCVLAEIFLFNFRFFLPKLSNAPVVTIGAGRFTELADGAEASENGLRADIDGAKFIIDAVGVPVYSVRFITAQDSGSFNAALSYTDGNFSETYQDAGAWQIVPGKSDTVHVVTSGRCGNVSVSLSGISKAAEIKAVEFNHETFSFCMPRFLLVFLFCLLLFLIRHFRLWRVPFRPGSPVQTWALLALMLCAAGFLFLVFFYGNASGFVSKSVKTPQKDSYQYLTQAFYHGQLSFLEKPPASFAELPNPYDFSQRSGDYLWDSIYYHGRYYSYFGIAPVILLLLPFRILTGYYLSTSLACLIFCLIALPSAVLLYRRIVELWFPDTNVLAYLAGAAAVCFSNLTWLLARAMFYELAVSSALAFLFLALNMLLPDAQRRGPTPRRLCLAGLFFGLMVASRPTFIFYIALALPFLYKTVFREQRRLSERVKPTAAFFTPLAVIAVILGGYNALRFGSPLDFGNKYQLTVSDVHFNRVTNVVQLVNGVFHYFFQPLGVDLKFPFFHVLKSDPSNVAAYHFNFPIAGIFNFPVMLILFAALPIVRRRMRHDPLKRWFVLLLLCVPLMLTFLDIMLAGALMRYTLDMYFGLLFCALILWLECIRYFSQRQAGEIATRLFAVIAGISVVISSLIGMVGEDNWFSQIWPQFYSYVSGIFEFWR